MTDFLQVIKESVIHRKHKEIEALVRSAIDENVDLDSIINEALIPAMDEVGQQFTKNLIFVPEMLASAITMKKAMEIVKPLLKTDAGAAKGTIILATVKGDLHDIGKNLVAMMLEGAGFTVTDLGVDVTVDKVVAAVSAAAPCLLGMSALLTTTMPEMKKVIDELTAKGLREKVRVMIGGAPIDAAFSQRIGADGYGSNAAAAVDLARNLTAQL